ncbi:uncharacterized protein LOC62_03G005026 [Vanrija pseudolonga]|uniref:Uncharacterized protein n=1 Tax=Vanrija pseudolonga TaxID=143232 RepID=A0AAF0YDH6_9TREE|nr:hypothetical protein LOC62_03G005026 [Vanrija pseudolonga]
MPRAQQPPPPTPTAADLQAPDSVNDVLLDAAVQTEPKPKEKLNIDDYRRLNRRATQNGMYTGMFGGAGLAFVASRFGVGKNGLALTFLLSATGISFFTTRSIINQSLGEHYSALRAQREPKAPGGGSFFPDTAGGDEAISTKDKEEETTPRDRLREELLGLGKQPRERTRWAKGRGLDGEVEEEAEMRDTYLRPGVPRT